jgi:Iron-containing redox enzyme
MKPLSGGKTRPMRPPLPSPRGPLSEELIVSLRGGPAIAEPLSRGSGGVFGDDHQLGLYVLYELHYRGFQDVDDRLEWDPSLLRLRAALEADFEAGLREEIASLEQPVDPKRIGSLVTELIEAGDGSELSIYMERKASLDQFREFLIHRSAYQLKEADPHSWAIPRLSGSAKAALVEVQADEYGGGRPDRVHATLFAKAMRALDLDPSYGAYLDRIPAVTLATVNLMSLFGLHRRLRGAIVGHLAGFEMTSPIPNSRYAKGLRRLGAGEDSLDFFDEHVEADSVHENIALYDMAQALAIDEPELGGDILFGLRTLLLLDARFAAHLLGCWERSASSLLEPVAAMPQ